VQRREQQSVPAGWSSSAVTKHSLVTLRMLAAVAAMLGSVLRLLPSLHLAELGTNIPTYICIQDRVVHKKVEHFILSLYVRYSTSVKSGIS